MCASRARSPAAGLSGADEQSEGAVVVRRLHPAVRRAVGQYIAQLIILGLTAMASAALTDGVYAVLGGRTGRFTSEQRVTWAQRVSGLFLIGGGAWLAFTRAREECFSLPLFGNGGGGSFFFLRG